MECYLLEVFGGISGVRRSVKRTVRRAVARKLNDLS